MIKKDISIYLLCVYLLLFQDLIQTYIPIFKYFDEVFSLMFLPILIFKCYRNRKNLKLKKNDLKIVISLILFVCIGLISNFVYKYQTYEYVIGDLLITLKFFLAYFLSAIIWNYDFYEKYSKKIYFHVRLIIYIMFLLTILNYTFNIFGVFGYRFGIKVNQLFYGTHTALAAAMIFLISLLIRCSKKTFSIELLFALLILTSTLRYKAIGAAIAIMILAFYIDKLNKKFTLSKFAIIAVIVILFAFDQISSYYIENDYSARKMLTTTSFKIAKDYFPLGAGYATYGSYFSAVSYSPLYYKYHLNKVYGLSNNYKENGFIFIFDTFWPTILGQFGFLGLVLYIYCLFIIFKKIQQDFSVENKYFYISKIICFAYLIISSTSEAAFMSPISIPLAFMLGTTKKNN